MDNKKVKIACFLGLSFLASLFLGQAVGMFFAFGFFDFLGKFPEFLLLTVFSFVFAGLAFCLPALFLTTQGLLLLASLVNCFGFLFGFWMLVGLQNFAQALFLALLFFVCQYLFFKGVQGRAKKFVGFFPADIFVPKVTTFLFYLTLVFSLSFYCALKGEIARGKFVIPEKLFEQVMGPATQVFQKSLEESLKKQMGGEFGRGLEKEIGTMSPEELARFFQGEMKETAKEGELRQELGFKPEFFEMPFSLGELRNKLQEAVEPFLKYLPILAAASLFFTLRIMISFLMIFLPWLIPITFRVLLKLGVFKIVEQQETVKRLSL